MLIKDKLDSIYKNNKYRFCGIDFDLFPNKDLIRIYDKIDGKIIYENFIEKYPEDYPIIEDYILLQPSKEELRKISEELYAPFAVCFYLGIPKELAEKPISAKMNFIS